MPGGGFCCIHKGTWWAIWTSWSVILRRPSLPLPQRMAAENKIAREVELNRYSFGKWSPAPYNWTWFTSGFVKGQAKMLTAETALAIERYRLANHGQIPDELKNLVPAFLAAVPAAGPADGQPLRFQKQGAGYVVSTPVIVVNYNGIEPEDAGTSRLSDEETGVRRYFWYTW